MAVDITKMEPDHICVLTNDVKETKRLVEAVFGSLEWRGHEVDFPQECMEVGSGFKIETAHADIGVCDIEIIRPLEGEDSYLMKEIREKGPGLHHFGYKFDNEEDRMECVERMIAAGYEVVQVSERQPGVKTHYLASPDGSMVYDIKSYSFRQKK